MKRIFIAFAAVLFVAMTSCEKEEITPSKPNPKENLRECKMCEGHWDLTDPTPKA